MKKKDEIKQYKSKSAKVLYKDLNDKYQHLQELKFSARFRKLKDVSAIKKCQKSIARISTILSEKLINKNGNTNE